MRPRAERAEQSPLRIGDVFLEKYQILEVAGSGGHGCVYGAQSLFMGREVAIKVLDRARGMTVEARARGQREAVALGRLGRHPGIVEVYDAGIDAEGRLYIVMERLEGRTLHQHLREHGPLDVETGLRLLIALCEALEFARLAKVVHRDIKPTNIFITPEGNPKLVDFGVAKITDAPGFQTAPQVVVGTALYVSPEQIRAQPATHRSDLYALGLVAYQLFCGEHPLLLAAPDADRRDLRVIWALHLQADPPRLDQVLPGFPEYVARLVHTAMSKEPAKRYATAAEFAKRARETLARYQNDRLGTRAAEHRAEGAAAPHAASAAASSAPAPGALSTRSDALSAASDPSPPILVGTPTPEQAVSNGTLKRSVATPPTEQFLPPTPSEPTGEPSFPSSSYFALPEAGRASHADAPPGAVEPNRAAYARTQSVEAASAWPALHEAPVWTPQPTLEAAGLRPRRGFRRAWVRGLAAFVALCVGGAAFALVPGWFDLLARRSGPGETDAPKAAERAARSAPARVQASAATVEAPNPAPRMVPPSLAVPAAVAPLASPSPAAPATQSAALQPAGVSAQPPARAARKPALRVAIRPAPVQEEEPRGAKAHWADAIVPPEAPPPPPAEEGARRGEPQPELWLN